MQLNLEKLPKSHTNQKFKRQVQRTFQLGRSLIDFQFLIKFDRFRTENESSSQDAENLLQPGV